ncbi:MAG: hypothetical protein AAFN74_24625, partial [Myxococcota bacterium]
LAMAVDLPVTPVRFVGGLPTTPVETKLEFPFGMGKQDYYIGRPMMPEELASLSYKARVERVIDAINSLGPTNEVPKAPDPAFAARVDDRQTKAPTVDRTFTVMAEVLASLASPSASTRRWQSDDLSPGEAEGWFQRAAEVLGLW